jgi:Ca2+-binding RTX toxin-like protein
VPANHTYASSGTYTLTLLAIDQHGEVSDAATSQAQVTVSGAELRVDPSDPSKKALYVCGTDGNDVIRFTKVGEGLAVSINGQTSGPFYGFGRVIACGGAGDDDIRMNAVGTYSVVFFGNSGNDVLVAGNGNSILDGGDGNDQITGGNGNDLLIGGLGSDTVQGGNGEDIVVAGRTSYDEGTDNDVRALSSILKEWTGGGLYETRISHITGASAGGLNGNSYFRASGPNQNVFDDGASDTVNGGNGRDWLLLHRGVDGDISDLAKNETATAI